MLIIKREKYWEEEKLVEEWEEERDIRSEWNIKKTRGSKEMVKLSFKDRKDSYRIWQMREECRRKGIIKVGEWLSFKKRKMRIRIGQQKQER